MDTSNHRPMNPESGNYGESCFHQRHQFGSCGKTDLSRRSIDWRDSGIVIDEDSHLFETLCSFDTRSSINSECNLNPTGSSSLSSAANVSAASCYPTQKIVFEQDDDGDTILHLAVVGFTLDKVKDLINLCDLNAINNMMQTPLHVAVLANRPEIVQLLIESRAQLDVHDRRGNTALHLASQRGFIEIADIVLAQKSQDSLTVQQMIETRNFDGYTSLHLAAINDKQNIIELLVVKYGASLNCRDSKSGETIMHKAVRQLNVDLVSFILGLSGQHCNRVDFAGRGPLDTVRVLEEALPKDASQTAKLSKIKALIEEGIRHCCAERGCCRERQWAATAAKRSESLEVSDYSSSSSEYSDAEYEIN